MYGHVWRCTEEEVGVALTRSVSTSWKRMQAARFVAGSGRGGTMIGLRLRRLSIGTWYDIIKYHTVPRARRDSGVDDCIRRNSEIQKHQ